MCVRTMYPQGMGKEVKRPTRLEVRLSSEDEAILDALSVKLGLNKTALVVLALRTLATKHRVKIGEEGS